MKDLFPKKFYTSAFTLIGTLTVIYSFSLLLTFSEAGATTLEQSQINIQNTQFTVSASFSTSTLSSNDTGTSTGILWPEIKARAAIVIDPIDNKVIYEKNADVVMPVASILKIVTAAVVDDLISQNPSLENKPLKITSNTNANQADRILKTGSSWYPNDLIKYMLISSSNKAAETLSRNIIPESSFISLMNHKVRQYGLKTEFYNSTGLPIYNSKTKTYIPAANSTAREVALLMWKIVQNHPGLLDATRIEHAKFSDNKTTLEVHNTNKLLGHLPIKFGKTGYSSTAGGTLVTVVQREEGSHAYVIVVLGSTAEDRFGDSYILATSTLSHYK